MNPEQMGKTSMGASGAYRRCSPMMRLQVFGSIFMGCTRPADQAHKPAVVRGRPIAEQQYLLDSCFSGVSMFQKKFLHPLRENSLFCRCVPVWASIGRVEALFALQFIRAIAIPDPKGVKFKMSTDTEKLLGGELSTQIQATRLLRPV
jgi:hypothetical protein